MGLGVRPHLQGHCLHTLPARTRRWTFRWVSLVCRRLNLSQPHPQYCLLILSTNIVYCRNAGSPVVWHYNLRCEPRCSMPVALPAGPCRLWAIVWAGYLTTVWTECFLCPERSMHHIHGLLLQQALVALGFVCATLAVVGPRAGPQAPLRTVTGGVLSQNQTV